jgi:MoxR-like ATPase
MATQNPVEQEGVYQLPEAQLDRFMMKLVVGYNTKEEEHKMVKRVANKTFGTIKAVITAKDLMEIKKEVLDIHIDKEVEHYIINLIDATRNPEAYGLDNIKKYIQFGVSPRASIDMYKASRAMAYLRGKNFVSPVDIAYIAKNIMHHRLVLSYEAEAEGKTADSIIANILQKVAIP